MVATLRKPRFQLPLWGFVCVGLFGYIVDSIIAYRLLTVVPEQTARIIALTALIVVMLYNELWNIVLFRWHNTLAGFLGVLLFLAPLAFLQVTLVLVDFVSAWLVLVYLVWVFRLRHSLGLQTLTPQSSRGAASSREIEAECGSGLPSLC